jgi:hypothetical protein
MNIAVEVYMYIVTMYSTPPRRSVKIRKERIYEAYQIGSCGS